MRGQWNTKEGFENESRHISCLIKIFVLFQSLRSELKGGHFRRPATRVQKGTDLTKGARRAPTTWHTAVMDSWEDHFSFFFFPFFLTYCLFLSLKKIKKSQIKIILNGGFSLCHYKNLQMDGQDYSQKSFFF